MRSTMVLGSFASFALALAPAISACSPPDPPTLTPESAEITGVALTGLTIDLKLQATNPNRIALTAQKVVGTATVNGKPLGTVTVPEAISIPANGSTVIDVALASPWSDLAAIGQTASATKPIPFSVDGTVTFGGGSLNVDLPFHTTGQITPDQMHKTIAGALAPQLQQFMQKGGASPSMPLPLPTKPKQ